MPDKYVIAIMKGEQSFVFIYDEASVDALLRTLQEYAADPDLALNWYDVAVLTQSVAALKERT